MPDEFIDEYTFALDQLSVALQNSYEKMRVAPLSRTNLDYSRIVLGRLRAFYCAQDKLKWFLNKRVAQAGSDFFVETILFSLKLFNDTENLNLQIASERAIEKKRNAIRPDISLWREDNLVAVVECKTQLGWLRHNWGNHIVKREQQVKTVFPEATIFWLVMTSCNWSGFGDDSRVGNTLFCLLREVWPTQISREFEPTILETPLEKLLEQVEGL